MQKGCLLNLNSAIEKVQSESGKVKGLFSRNVKANIEQRSVMTQFFIIDIGFVYVKEVN